MDKVRRKQLEKLFEAPKPVGKRKFFRNIDLRPAGMRHLLAIQFSYISRWSWAAAFGMFGVMVYLSRFNKQGMLSAVLSMMPLLVLAGISECVRSSTYGMEELEQSSRFSLKSILLARMVIVGIEDIVLAVFFAWIVGDEYGRFTGQGYFGRTMIYLFVSYLLAASGSLWIVRNFNAKENIYVCTGFILLVSGLAFCSTTNFWWIYEENYLSAWVGAAMLLGGLTFYEGRKMLYGNGGLIWS
ncbi:MAG: hypothetical protein HFH72_05280 [Lachnospiraceae bacterium]|nr:hypothetical protein [Lachnospiraceae bacterium]